MKTFKSILFALLLGMLLPSCNFLTNSFSVKDKTQDILNAIIAEDYEKAMGYMDGQNFTDNDREQMQQGFTKFRDYLIANFGKDIKCSFVKTTQTWVSTGTNDTSSAIVAFIEISGSQNAALFKAFLNDETGKIIRLTLVNGPYAIPGFTIFGLFGLLALVVPIFNLYVLLQIKRSNLRKKGWKYLAVFLFNVPTITYTVLGGFTLEPFNFQFLLGIGAIYGGYAGTSVSVGFPLGGLYWLWKVRKNARQEPQIDDTTTSAINELYGSVDNAGHVENA